MQTQNKLQYIQAAAKQIGVHGQTAVHNCITTGQLANLSMLVSSVLLLLFLAKHTFPKKAMV